jgi:hypothetical protein
VSDVGELDKALSVDQHGIERGEDPRTASAAPATLRVVIDCRLPRGMVLLLGLDATPRD